MNLDHDIPWEVDAMCDENEPNADHGHNAEDEMDVDDNDDAAS